MNEHNYNANGVRLNYVEGPCNGDPLVLIPGQAATWKNYEPVFKKLSSKFHLYAITIRGHGKSDWTKENYNFETVGKDLVLFLENVVKRPAVLSGNSSGGLICLWLGVNYPHLVSKIILEDAPLFSADWPRIKNEFVYEALTKTVKHLGKPEGPDFTSLFRSIERPLPNGKTTTLPGWLCQLMAWLIEHRENIFVKFLISISPRKLCQLINDLPLFDPNFSKAWVDGTFYRGLNHEESLRKLKVPLLILHADWFRTSKGLIGAMDDNDALMAKRLAPSAKYVRIKAPHDIHAGEPDKFVKLVVDFTSSFN